MINESFDDGHLSDDDLISVLLEDVVTTGRRTFETDDAKVEITAVGNPAEFGDDFAVAILTEDPELVAALSLLIKRWGQGMLAPEVLSWS